MKQSTFIIADMCCVSEEQIIRNRLKNMSGVEQLDFNVM